jgi:predicted tellurium resistance membrane protein TerC
MNSAAKIVFAIAAVIIAGAAVNLLVEHFHLPQTYASAGIGIVIGAGIALAALSFTRKGTTSGSTRVSRF